MSYALIQKSLEQRISIDDLKQASTFVPSVAQADCHRIGRDLFGIVETKLSYDDAVAFQVALEHFRFPTEIVPDADLPRLSDPQIKRGIRFGDGLLTAVDGMGREESFPLAEVQFAGGGFCEAVRVKTERRMDWNPHRGTSRQTADINPIFIMRKHERETREPEFHFELFLSCAPYRLQFLAHKESLFRYDGTLLRFQQREQFLQILQRLASILPSNFLSLGFLAARKGKAFSYPSKGAIEEEIVWHLYRRLRAAGR